MANDKHVARLKKGVRAWNAWREKNRDISPDLSGADLNGTHLRGANLSEATKIIRAIAIRYDQLADSFLGMLYLATARYWRP
jgi:uncharacterized protein YjbI with pentapeptide repeats